MPARCQAGAHDSGESISYSSSLRELMTNTLYYGDNLPILRDYIAPASVDLVYLDPPFNNSRHDNVLFRNERGQESAAQILACEDTWTGNVGTKDTNATE